MAQRALIEPWTKVPMQASGLVCESSSALIDGQFEAVRERSSPASHSRTETVKGVRLQARSPARNPTPTCRVLTGPGAPRDAPSGCDHARSAPKGRTPLLQRVRGQPPKRLLRAFAWRGPPRADTAPRRPR